MNNPTPVPYVQQDASQCEAITTPSGYFVARTPCKTAQDFANAAFIVEACNSYETLRAEYERLKVKDDTRSGYIDELAAEITRLKAQRDELLRVLGNIESTAEVMNQAQPNELWSTISKTLKQHRAALAAVKKE